MCSSYSVRVQEKFIFESKAELVKHQQSQILETWRMPPRTPEEMSMAEEGATEHLVGHERSESQLAPTPSYTAFTDLTNLTSDDDVAVAR